MLYTDFKDGDLIQITGAIALEFMDKTGRKAMLNIGPDEAIQIKILPLDLEHG